MSLMDTIKGAREEAAANGNPFERSERTGRKDDARETSTSDATSAAGGFERRSAARGKPRREAAAGVRVVSAGGKMKAKSRATMTKEEKKEERNRERELEDRRYSVREMMLKENPEYKRVNKVWHILLGVGFAIAFVALTLYGMVNGQGENPSVVMAVAAMVFMILGYLVMGAALIYNWRKLKPLRTEADQRVMSMSDKQLRNAINRGSVKKAEAR